MITKEEVREKLEQYLDYSIELVQKGVNFLAIVQYNGGLYEDYYVFDEVGQFTHHESLQEAMDELSVCEKQVCHS